ncbi:Nuclear cap-binding protein subunit 1 [Savitreella phatthalungensis]
MYMTWSLNPSRHFKVKRALAQAHSHYHRSMMNRKRRGRGDLDPGDGDVFRRRRTRDAEPIELLKRDLFALGDPGRHAVLEEIDIVAERIGRAHRDILPGKTISGVFAQSLSGAPAKIPHFAALTIRIARYAEDVADDILRHLRDCLSEVFGRGDFWEAKLLLRFFASLGTESSTAASLAHINQIADTIDQTNPRMRRELLEIGLLTLAYTCSFGHVDSIQLEATLDKYAAHVQRVMEVDKVFQHFDGATSADTLDCLQRQCERDPRVLVLPKYLLQADTRAPNCQPATLVLRETTRSSATGQAWLSVFQDQRIESVPSVHETAASVLRDLVGDILRATVLNRHEAARFLIDLECYLEPGSFVLRGTPLDKIDPTGPSLKAEDVVVDAIFGCLLRLPEPVHKCVYYHSVLTELCKIVPQAIAPTFGRVIRFLYSSLETLDPELTVRFGHWFTHHLSNFGFNWKWQDWQSDVALPDNNPRKIFLRECLLREAELSYCQRIRNTLPDAFLSLIPPDMPPLAFESPSEEAAELFSLIEQRADPEQIDALLGNHSPSKFVEQLLRAGAQSCSHALGLVKFYHKPLSHRSFNDVNSGVEILEVVFRCWSARPAIAVHIALGLINDLVLSTEALIAWLANLQLETIRQWYPYEIIGLLESSPGQCRKLDPILNALHSTWALPSGSINGHLGLGLARLIHRRCTSRSA